MLKKLFAATIVLGLMTATPATMTATSNQKGKPGKPSDNKQCPHMCAAEIELGDAKRELQSAAHDFGGHRAEALEAVDNAKKQIADALAAAGIHCPAK